MKRSGAPRRRTPLAPGRPLAGAGLARGTALQARSPLTRTRKAQARPRDTGPDAKTRLAVYDRDGWRCVCCGESIIGRPHSAGHRKRRSQGGSNRKSNLLTFLGFGNGMTENDHHQRIDQRKDPRDEARGLTVRSGQDPATVAVRRFSEGAAAQYPTDDGRWANEPPEVVA